MAERLGVDRTIILNMNTVAGIVGVIIAIIAGQLNQRIGPAKVAAGCLISWRAWATSPPATR